jgi:hypothetical protein
VAEEGQEQLPELVQEQEEELSEQRKVFRSEPAFELPLASGQASLLLLLEAAAERVSALEQPQRLQVRALRQ